MVSLTLLSTVLMGLFVVVTFVAAMRFSSKREPPADRNGEDRYAQVSSSLNRLANNPTVWTLTFILLAVGFGAAAVVAVGDFGLSEGISGGLLAGVYALVGLMLFAFVFLGAYFGIRERGLGNAHGVAAGTLAVGFVFLFVVAAQLTIGVIG